MQIARLYKQGGSTVMAVPARFLKSLGWGPGTDLEIILAGKDQIIARKLTQPQALTPREEPSFFRGEEAFHAPD